MEATRRVRSGAGPAALVLMAVVLSAGCSRFEEDWKAAMVTPAPTNDMTGRWIGTWQNSNNEHSGPMRAIIKRVDDTHVSAHYKARWGGIFDFESMVVLTTERRGEVFHFTGESYVDSWVAGGVYEYEGNATPTEFTSSYEHPENTGTYTMRRPVGGE